MIIRRITDDNRIISQHPIRVEFAKDQDLITLLEDISFVIPRVDAKVTLLAGLQSDGASIPRLFWRVLYHPFEVLILRRGLLHDGIYKAELFPRLTCDLIFRDYMAQERLIPAWRCEAIYRGVRIGGKYVWRNEHTAESVAEARRLVVVS
ncbi:MAG: DUF1353 domain-containing protein [Clostridia bacterium]|nr:DUF1353 domain-containing protein [Clostridia bacterium]